MRVQLPPNKATRIYEMTEIIKRRVGRPVSTKPKGETIYVSAEYVPVIKAVLEMLKTAKENLRR